MVSHNSKVTAWIFAFGHSRGSTVASIAICTVFAAVTVAAAGAAGTAGSRFAHPNCDSLSYPGCLGCCLSFSFSWISFNNLSLNYSTTLLYACMYGIELYQRNDLSGCETERDRENTNDRE